MNLRFPIAAVCFCLLLSAPGNAQAQTVRPSFEVATVRPDPQGDPNKGQWSIPSAGDFHASHVTLALLLQLAYAVDASQIVNKPAWLDTELYNVAAKPEDGVHLTREELQPRLQSLLAERFHLVCHTETRNVRGYASPSRRAVRD